MESAPINVGGAVSAGDLAEVMAAFNEATLQVARTHEALRAEVSRLQAELRSANDQLERSRRLAALGEMAAGIAHEVRNPLGSIGLYAGHLADDLADRPAQRATARKIIEAVRTLDAIVSDVLSFAREMRVRPEPARASELFDRALEQCAGLLSGGGGAGPESAGVEVVRLDRGPGLMVSCDGPLVVRALANLVRNAVEAMSEEGHSGPRRLELGASRVRGVRGRGPGGPGGSGAVMARLRVRDTGPGIPPEVMERMFNPFFTTRRAGTGLGLAIVHRIVDAHGGRVSVRNEGDGGASVELYFPVAGLLPAAEGAGASGTTSTGRGVQGRSARRRVSLQEEAA